MVLHDLRSMHNVGSIFRTADAAGVAHIYACGTTPSPTDRLGRVRPQIAKVALGAEGAVPWSAEHDTGKMLRELKREGFKIWAVEQDRRRGEPYFAKKIGPKDRIALVLGEEVSGIPPRLLRLAEEVIEIPMLGKKESLNVAVAFGIAVYGIRY